MTLCLYFNFREETLQRKLEDSEKSLSEMKEKLDDSSKELSRVNSELAMARGEVEAHAQAAEKQRKSMVRALEEAAAESQRKQSELIQRMKQRECEMEEQLGSERAGSKLKIRCRGPT